MNPGGGGMTEDRSITVFRPVSVEKGGEETFLIPFQ
jgi:hypothetical protein